MRKIQDFYKRHPKGFLGLALFIFVLIIFHYRMHLGFAWPTWNSLVMQGDWAQHYLSWEFFRALPWQWPLGTLENYFYPFTSSIGYTDSIPLLAFFFKLFSPILPQDFQYIGLWLLGCFFLQAFFAVKLLEALTIKKPIHLFLGALFFVASPVLLFRLVHPALCAQWLILASLWLYFRNGKTLGYGRGQLYQLGLVALSALIHPYLTVMIVAMAVAYYLRLRVVEKIIRLPRFFLLLGSTAGIVAIIWEAIGYFSLSPDSASFTGDSYNSYSANLTTFFNPLDYSSIFEFIPLSGAGQTEGFAYLGFGILLLAGLVIFRERLGGRNNQVGYSWRWLAPIVAVALGFSVFALSNIVTWETTVVFQYPLPEWADTIADTFRAGGRFIWVLYYLIFTFVFYGLAKTKLSPRFLTVILVAALVVQLYDIFPLLERQHRDPKPYNFSYSEEWHGFFEKADIIITYKPFQRTNLMEDDYIPFVYLAHRHNVPITTGYLARHDYKGVATYLKELQESIAHGEPNPDAIYISIPKYENDFNHWKDAGLVTVDRVDGYVVYTPTNVKE